MLPELQNCGYQIRVMEWIDRNTRFSLKGFFFYISNAFSFLIEFKILKLRDDKIFCGVIRHDWLKKLIFFLFYLMRIIYGFSIFVLV